MSDWIQALQEVKANRVEAVPSGWQTTKQLEAVLSLGPSRTALTLQRLLAAGRAEKQPFAVLTKTGRILRVPHYRLLKKGKP